MSEPQRLNFAINGTSVNPDYTDRIQEIIVDSAMRMPDMASVYLYDDQEMSLIKSTSTVAIGDELTIFSFDGQKTVATLFSGLVASIEPNFGHNGRASLMIQAYDRSFLLHRGKHTKTYLDASDKDVMQEMVKTVGMTLDYSGALIVHSFVLQNNQTHMEWILMRAEQMGAQVFVREKKLHFWEASKVGQGEKPILTWTDNLLSFRLRRAAVHQPQEIRAVSWDVNKAEQIMNKTTASKSKGHDPFKTSGGSQKYEKPAKAVVDVVDIPFADAKGGEALGLGYLLETDNRFLQAEGVALGNDGIIVGNQVTVQIREDKVAPYTGDYQITAVRHIYRMSGRWESHFTISGRQPNTLTGLLDGGQDKEKYNNRINGVIPGLVTNFKDPDNLGRIKVKYPTMLDGTGTEVESDWAPLLAPSAGKERGFFYIPEVDDQVLIAFEHGDPQRPYVIGSLWNQKSPPPKKSSEVNDGANITQRIIKSRSGHIIVLDDSSGQEQILIQDKSEQNRIVIDTKTNGISIIAKGDIDIDAGGNINVNAKGMISTKSGVDTKMTVGANYKMTATGSMEMKATATGKIEATANLDIKSMAMLNLEAMATATLKGTAMVIVQGALIKLN